MHSHEGPSGKPRQATPDPPQVARKAEGNRLGALVGSSLVALEDPRAPRDPDHPKEMNLVQVLARQRQLQLFCTNVYFVRITARGNMWPIVDKPPGNKTTYPWGHKFEVDQSVEDSALAATMLSGAVSNSLMGVPAGCNCECDTECGCDYCIPKEIVAAPAESRDWIGLLIRVVPKILSRNVSCQMTLDIILVARSVCSQQMGRVHPPNKVRYLFHAWERPSVHI